MLEWDVYLTNRQSVPKLLLTMCLKSRGEGTKAVNPNSKKRDLKVGEVRGTSHIYPCVEVPFSVTCVESELHDRK